MPADVEVLLGELAKSWEAAAIPITLAEVHEAPSRLIDVDESADGAEEQGGGRRWLVAACAVLVVGSMVALAVIGRGGTDAPVTTLETTTAPSTPNTTSTPPQSTTTPPDSDPIEASGHGSWWPLGPLADKCRECTGIVLDDGRVAFIQQFGGGRRVVQLFDPATATFSVGATLPFGVRVSWIIQLDDGRLLLTGMYGDIAIAGLDDGSIEIVREDGEATAAIQLHDGRVLLFDMFAISTLDLVTHAITEISDIGADPLVLIELSDGNVLVAQASTSQIFDPDAGSLRPFGDGSWIPWAAMLADGRLLMVRGVPGDATRSRTTTQIYDHSTGTFTDLGTWNPAAVLDDGRVLELQPSVSTDMPIPYAAIHDLDAGTVHEIDVPTGNRLRTKPIALPDGRVLIVGGFADVSSDALTADENTAEIFAIGDPRLPDDCCPPHAHDISNTAEVTGTSLAPLIGHSIRVRVTFPPRALSGAIEASWRASEERDVERTGYGGELPLPPHCEQGCEVDLPWSIAPTSHTTALSAAVAVVYETDAPPTARDITLTIEATAQNADVTEQA